MTDLTPRRQAVLDVLVLAAESGQPCPPDKEIAFAIGIATAGGASRHVLGLVDMRLITIDRVGHSRYVTIRASGATTAKPPGRERAPPPSDVTLTQPQKTVLRLVTHAAERGFPAPPTDDLNAELGTHKAVKLIQELKDLGVIRVERRGNRRVVTIVATGARTKVPDTPAPLNVPLRVRRTKRAMAEAAEALSETAASVQRERDAKRARVFGEDVADPRPDEMVLGPEPTCRFPSGHSVADYTFCGAASWPDSSYCPEHHNRCYREYVPRSKRRAAA